MVDCNANDRDSDPVDDDADGDPADAYISDAAMCDIVSSNTMRTTAVAGIVIITLLLQYTEVLRTGMLELIGDGVDVDPPYQRKESLVCFCLVPGAIGTW